MIRIPRINLVPMRSSPMIPVKVQNQQEPVITNHLQTKPKTTIMILHQIQSQPTVPMIKVLHFPSLTYIQRIEMREILLKIS